MRAWITRRFEAYGRLCLVAAVFLSPTIFAPLSFDTFSLTKLTILWVLGMAALAFWVLSCLGKSFWIPRSRLFFPAVAFLLSATLSAALSASPKQTLLGHYTRYGGLLPYVIYALIGLAIYGLFWERPNMLRQIALAASAAAFAVAGYVLIQAAGLDWHEWRNPSGEAPTSPTGTLGNSNFAGGYLAISLPLAFYVSATKRSTQVKVLSGALLGVITLALWYTQARGAMVGAIVGFTVLAFSYRERIPLWAKALILSALALLAAVAVIAIWHPGSSSKPKPVREVRQLDSFSLQNRFWYWTAAFRIFRAHPLLGTGPDTYLSHYPKHRVAEDGKRMGLNLPDKPHNVILEHFSNLGALGGAAYLMTAAATLWYGYRRSRQIEGGDRLLLVCFTSAMVSYLSQASFSIDVPPLAVMFWVILGAIAAAADPAAVLARSERDLRAAGQLPDDARAGRKTGRLIAVAYAAVFVLVASLILVGAQPLRADVKAATGRAEEAIKLNPLEAEYSIRAGDAVRSVAASTRNPALAADFFRRAERHYERALTIQPGNIVFMMKIATLHGTWARTTDPSRVVEATRRWKRIYSLDPHDRDVKTAYDSARSAQRRTISRMEQFVGKHPGEAKGWLALGKLYLELGRVGDARAAREKALLLEPGNAAAMALLKRSG